MTRNRGTTAHYGVDYAGEGGDPVFAMYDGKVTKVGYSSTYGPNHVRTSSVINGTRYNVDYGHLSSASVVKGQQVNAGNLIGLMGKEGNLAGTAFPPHVHIAVWRSVSIQGATMGFVQPSYTWRSHTIPWQYRLYF
jgi:murein DD-endopeptidase MepM/ murein hydrolase activator NlpD